MARYRKKPVIVEVEQWFEGMQIDGVVDFAMYSECWFDKTAEDGRYSVDTLEGPQVIRNGDYVITGVKGEKYLCKPDIFEMTYERVGD